jgi:hypothetical protein
MLKLAGSLPSGAGHRWDTSGFVGVPNLDDDVVVEELVGWSVLSRSLSSSLPGPCRRRIIGSSRQQPLFASLSLLDAYLCREHSISTHTTDTRTLGSYLLLLLTSPSNILPLVSPLPQPRIYCPSTTSNFILHRASNQYLSTHAHTRSLLTHPLAAYYRSLSTLSLLDIIFTRHPCSCSSITIVSLLSVPYNLSHLLSNHLHSVSVVCTASFQVRLKPPQDAWVSTLLSIGLRLAFVCCSVCLLCLHHLFPPRPPS